MYVTETSLRVRYAETDRMGYVYYGNYAQYYEVGRVEALRTLGLSYKEIEDAGVALPVLTFNIRYIRPAFYDDLLLLKVTIPEMPGIRIKFLYEMFNEKGELLNTGETVLVFVDRASGKPCGSPKEFLERLKVFFSG